MRNRWGYLFGGIVAFATVYIALRYSDIEISHTIFSLLIIGLSAYGSIFYADRKNYYQALSAIMMVLCSIFLIIYNTQAAVPFKGIEFLTYIAFASSVAQLLLLTRCALGGGRVFLGYGLIFLIIMCPVILLWGYYFSANAWLSVESCMAILQTNPAEAQSYINDHFNITSAVGLIVVFALLLFALWLIKSVSMSKVSGKMVGALIFFVILNMAFVYRTRENIVTMIGYDTYAYAESYREYVAARERRQENIKQLANQISQGDEGVYILVIGESETRDHMGCYGYGRDTTPWMSSLKNDEGYVQFSNAWSCHTTTTANLTYALTSKNQYNTVDLQDSISLVDIANAAGYDTVWLSNQVQYGFADTPVTAIAADAKQQIWIHDKIGHMNDGGYVDLPEFYDEKLVSAMDDIQLSHKMLIVIHLMGSHNTYKMRYPENYALFHGADNELIDEYDNSIAYTDNVLREIYLKAEEIPNFKWLMYFSDHGEGIDSFAGHDINRYSPQMTRIPMILLMSKRYMQDYVAKSQVIRDSADRYFTNDLIFNNVIALMNIDVGKFTEQNNIIYDSAYDNNRERFTTVYGQKSISDE